MNYLTKISFIGCGNMASAIVQGLVSTGMPADQIMASNPSNEKLKAIKSKTGILTTRDNIKAANFSDCLVLSIKPQILPKICEQLSSIDLTKKLIISVAAGVSSKKIGELLTQPLAVIRAMPNTPALVSEAATGLYANELSSKTERLKAEEIFLSIGEVKWVENESLIDVVTGISGSAPAYIFLFIQSMINQAVKQGLDPETARTLATQAVKGSALLAQNQNSTPLCELQKRVTSPGGTTEAAIKSFEENNFSNIIEQAVAAAISRGKELGEHN